MLPSNPVTLAEAAELLKDTGASYCAIKRWRDDGRFHKVGVVPVNMKNKAAFLYELEEVRQVAVKMLRIKHGDMPEGWIGIGEAAKILKTSPKSLGYLATKGCFQAKKIDFRTVRRKWIFLRKLVEEAAPLGMTGSPAFRPMLHVEEFPERPLISASNILCIEARRQKLRRDGIVVNVQKVIEDGKRVG